MARSDTGPIAWKIFSIHAGGVSVAAAAMIYLNITVMDSSWAEVRQTLVVLAAMLVVLVGVAPWFTLKSVVEGALRVKAIDRPGERLTRILQLPRRVEFILLGYYSLGVVLYDALLIYKFPKPAWVAAWATFVTIVIILLTMTGTKVPVERVLRNLAVEEFHRHPDAPVPSEGWLWPRMSWYLPYVLGLFVVGTLVTTSTVVARTAMSAIGELEKAQPELAATLTLQFGQFIRDASLPLLLLGVFIVITASVAALQTARHVQNGARAVEATIRGFAAGRPQLPDWVGTDEIGELSRATAAVFGGLQGFARSLTGSATRLRKFAEGLGESSEQQSAALGRQAAAVVQTSTTAEEVKQASVVAAQKAQGILEQSDTVQALGASTEKGVTRTIEALREIHAHVTQVASRIAALEESSTRLTEITEAVKSLADDSSILALNAAIEASRSGTQGKGLSIIANEIRSLAAQSLQATANAQEILRDLGRSISDTAQLTKEGTERLQSSVTQVEQFGQSTQKISSVVRDSVQSARQISQAVTEQVGAISQIFQAVNALTVITRETVSRVDATKEFSRSVRSVAEEVTQTVTKQGWTAEARAD